MGPMHNKGIGLDKLVKTEKILLNEIINKSAIVQLFCSIK